MDNLVVHRIVELHAATRGEVTALDQQGDRITYRDLNVRANGVARRLVDAGFHRSAHLLIMMDHGIDLATVLLAVLKAGGTYTWRSRGDRRQPSHAAFGPDPIADLETFRLVGVQQLLQSAGHTSSNLPVLTRPTDLACVLESSDGGRVLVPHSTLTALNGDSRFDAQEWNGDPSTFDLWAGLMAGLTLSVVGSPAFVGAA